MYPNSRLVQSLSDARLADLRRAGDINHGEGTLEPMRRFTRAMLRRQHS
jgi:hypothetical protein